jgi:hypothetical protein
MALGGAACFIFFVGVVVCSLVFYFKISERIQPGWHFVERGWQFGSVGLASLAAAAALSTTVCGWVAATNIRRSSGAIYGLGLALFDALVFPLLFADFLVFVLVFSFTPMMVTLMFGSLQPNSAFNRLSIAAVSLLAAVVLDFFIVRKVWRSYRR